MVRFFWLNRDPNFFDILFVGMRGIRTAVSTISNA